jgi:hypothetical protein
MPPSRRTWLKKNGLPRELVPRQYTRAWLFAGHEILLVAIVRFDCIRALPDGRLVGFIGVKGPSYLKNIQFLFCEGIDAVTAAALPASALTSLFPLKWGAKL